MATVSIELAREYLRVLEGEDEMVLSFLLEAAEAELQACGVVIPKRVEIAEGMEVTEEIIATNENYEAFMKMYRLAVLLHVSMHYENRSAAVNVEKLSVSYNNLLLKLKKWGESVEI